MKEEQINQPNTEETQTNSIPEINSEAQQTQQSPSFNSEDFLKLRSQINDLAAKIRISEREKQPVQPKNESKNKIILSEEELKNLQEEQEKKIIQEVERRQQEAAEKYYKEQQEQTVKSTVDKFVTNLESLSESNEEIKKIRENKNSFFNKKIGSALMSNIVQITHKDKNLMEDAIPYFEENPEEAEIIAATVATNPDLALRKLKKSLDAKHSDLKIRHSNIGKEQSYSSLAKKSNQRSELSDYSPQELKNLPCSEFDQLFKKTTKKK